jgi:hypothetical protein
MPCRHHCLLTALAIAVLSSGLADARMRALIGGQLFSAPSNRGDYTGAVFLVSGRSRHGAEPGTTRALSLACGPIAPGDALPKTVPCVSSTFATIDTASSNVQAMWSDDVGAGTLQATVTSFVKLRARFPRWRIRGTFSGTLGPFENASSPIEITEGRFGGIVLHSLVGGGALTR